MNPSAPIKVGILGATGAVGQRLVQLLDGHPWFRVTALAGSERSAGRPYGEACRWLLSGDMPAWAREMPVQEVHQLGDVGREFPRDDHFGAGDL